MVLVINNRVYETSTTAGLGTLDLDGPETGYRGFVAGVGGTNTCYYTIQHHTANEWEVGIGTVTDAAPDTLSRDTVLDSSTGAKVDFSAGTKDVFIDVPASKTVWRDSNGDVLSQFADSDRIYFGAADDAYIEFDGNSLNIVANAVTVTDDLTITADNINVGTGISVGHTASGEYTYTVLLQGNGYDNANGSNYFYRNVAAASTAGPVVFIHNDHLSDDQPCLVLRNDGSGALITGYDSTNTLVLTIPTTGGLQLGAAAALYYTRTELVNIYSDANGSNYFYRNVAAASTAGPVVYIFNDHASDDQPCLLIRNDGSGAGIQTSANIEVFADSKRVYFGAADDAYIEFDGNSLNIVANAVTATDDMVLVADGVAVGPVTFVPSYDFSVGSADGSDQVGIYHDNTDAYLKWNDGYLNLQTDEGTDTTTVVNVKGKGDAEATVNIMDEDDAEFLQLTCSGGYGYIRVAGAAAQALYCGSNFWPETDNTHYLGKNDDDTPYAWKGLVLKDQGGTGKYYRLEVFNDAVRIVDLTD